MTTGENKAVVRRFVEEVINAGNLEAVDELVAPGHANHDPTAPEPPRGGEDKAANRDVPRGLPGHPLPHRRDDPRGEHRRPPLDPYRNARGAMMSAEPAGGRVEVRGWR